METLEYISLREAAQLLGISLRAIRGRVKSRNVPLVTVAGKHGDRYVLSREYLPTLGENSDWSASATVPGPATPSNSADWTLLRTMSGEGFRAPSPPREPTGTVTDTPTASGEAAQRTASETVPDSDGREPGQTIPYEVHLVALETTRKAIEAAQEAHVRADQATMHVQRLERAAWTLQSELTSYRRALAEQAESLAEKEALGRQAEEQRALLTQLEGERDEALRLIDENAQESQRQQEALRAAESRAAWLEQKVPRWLRKLLGAN